MGKNQHRPRNPRRPHCRDRLDFLGFLVDGVLLAPRWAEDMKALGHPDFSPNQWIGYNLLGLVCGIALIWIYAAIRPRFGAGVMTAVYAGLAVWFIGVLIHLDSCV